MTEPTVTPPRGGAEKGQLSTPALQRARTDHVVQIMIVVILGVGFLFSIGYVAFAKNPNHDVTSTVLPLCLGLLTFFAGRLSSR